VFNFFNLPNQLGYNKFAPDRRMLTPDVDGFSFSWRSHPYTLTVNNPCGEGGTTSDASDWLEPYRKAIGNKLMTLASGTSSSASLADITDPASGPWPWVDSTTAEMRAAYKALTPPATPPYECGKWVFYVEYDGLTTPVDPTGWVVYNTLGAHYPDITNTFGLYSDISDYTITAIIPENTPTGTYTYKFVGEFFLENLGIVVDEQLPAESTTTKRITFDIDVIDCLPKVDCSAHTPVTPLETLWYGDLTTDFSDTHSFASVIG
jgi:hypothetical protein